MKIILMFKTLDRSGAPKILAWLANRLAQEGHQVVLLAFFDGECEQPLGAKVRFCSLNLNNSRHWILRNTVGMANAVVRLDRFLSKEKPDLLITFQDSIGLVYMLINKLHHKFKIITSERVDPYSYRAHTGKLTRFFMQFADGIVFQTEGARNFFAKNSKIYNRSEVIPNPVILTPQMNAFLNAPRVRFRDRDNRIVTAGRLSLRQKRQDVLLKAFAIVHQRHPEMTLHLYGAGEDIQKIQAMTSELGLENAVVFEGVSSQVLQDIRNAKVFVLSSDYEGIPNALIEAMVVGVPSVSTDCSPGGARLLIRDGENGYLVPCGDHSALANRIVKLIEQEQIAERFSEASVKVHNEFTEDAITKRWCDYIMRIRGK